MAVLWILCVLINMGIGVDAVLCYWCSGVGADRECERHPYAVRTGPIYINCRSRFCITAKVTDANTGEVHSFARLCDNIPHGNQCVQDARLLTCYESCTEDLCNNGNPGPHYLKTINYASNSDNNNNKVIDFVSESEATKKEGKEMDISRGGNRTSANNWTSLGTKKQEKFFGNPDGDIADDDNGDTGGVHDRRLNGKEDLARGRLFGDYIGNDAYDDGLGETGPGASSGRQESGAASVSSKMEDWASEHRDQGKAGNLFSSKHSSSPGASNDRESFNALRKSRESQGIPEFAEPTSPVVLTWEHEERLEPVFPLRKTDGDDFSFQKWQISKKRFPELHSKSFGKGEEWIFNSDQMNAPLFNTDSISRKLAPMVMDKHPSAYSPSRKLQDQVQVEQNSFVVDATETSSSSNPKSYDLTSTFGPRTLSHEELSSSLQSKPEYLYLLSHLRDRNGKDDSKWIAMKSSPEISTPHPPYWSPHQSPHPSVASYFYSRKTLAPVVNVQSPFDRSLLAVLLDSGPTSVSSGYIPTTTADYPPNLSILRSPDARILSQLPREDPILLQQSLHIPKSNPLFSAHISSFPYNNSLASHPGLTSAHRPKIDSYSVIQTKQSEDFRFPPNAESHGGEHWGSEDLTPDAAFVETGYKMDSLDDIVSAFRQHPGNRYSTAKPPLQSSLSSVTSAIPEASVRTPSLLENHTSLDSFAGSDQGDVRLLPLTTTTDQSPNILITNNQKLLLSTVSMNTTSSSLIGTIAEVSSVTPENDEQLFSSSTAADQGLLLLAITSAMNSIVETRAKHGISPQTKLREENTITESIRNLSATDDEFKVANNDKSEFRNLEQNVPDDETIATILPFVSDFSLNSATGISNSPSTLESPLAKLHVNRAPVNISSSLHTIPLLEGQSGRQLKAFNTEISPITLAQEEFTEKVKHAKDNSPMNVKDSKKEGNKGADANIVNNFPGREAAGIQKPFSDHNIVGVLKIDVLNMSTPRPLQLTISDELITTLQSKQTGDIVSSPQMVSDTSATVNISGNSKSLETTQAVNQYFSSQRSLTNKQYNSSKATQVPQQFSSFDTNQTTLQHNSSMKTQQRNNYMTTQQHNRSKTTQQHSSYVTTQDQQYSSFVTTNTLPMSQRQLQPRLETAQVPSASPSIEASKRQPPPDSLQESAGDHSWSTGQQEIVSREPHKELVVSNSVVNQGISAQIQPDFLVPESSITSSTGETRGSRAFESSSHEFSYTLRPTPDTIKPTYFMATPTHDALRSSSGRMRSLAVGENTLVSPAAFQTTSRLKILTQSISKALVTSSPSTLTSASPVHEASKMSVGRPMADVRRVFNSEGREINKWSHVHNEKGERNGSTIISHGIASLLAVMLTLLFCC